MRTARESNPKSFKRNEKSHCCRIFRYRCHTVLVCPLYHSMRGLALAGFYIAIPIAEASVVCVFLRILSVFSPWAMAVLFHAVWLEVTASFPHSVLRVVQTLLDSYSFTIYRSGLLVQVLRASPFYGHRWRTSACLPPISFSTASIVLPPTSLSPF